MIVTNREKVNKFQLVGVSKHFFRRKSFRFDFFTSIHYIREKCLVIKDFMTMIIIKKCLIKTMLL